MTTIKEVIQNLPNIFKPEKAKGWNRIILFDLEGEEPSQWTLTIENGTASIEEGNTKQPKLTILGKSEHIVQMFTGEVPPMKLVNAKLIKMKGPMMDAIAFSGLWNIPKK
ncbi:MAG: SCP2 sterol-binding domain-containing protein [Anaerolineaceae bacterium]|nr:SCP2 sterol-binding domain-containing protein [Anaerolineaceae bacterium]